MQSYKLGTSVNPGGGSSNPQPSPASWQIQDSSYGGIKLYDPNAVFQQNPDSNPHLNAQQNAWAAPTGFLSGGRGTEYSQNQQWNWTNGAQLAPASSTWSWENSRMHHTSGDYHLQHHCSLQTQLPSYDQSASVSQPQQQIHWDTVQNQNQSTIHRSFSDMWNWGDDSGSNTPISSSSAIGQESQNDVSHQLRQGPDGQDQWANAYQNWNSVQQNQYSWNQAIQQNYQTSSELPNSWHCSATATESNGTETSTSVKCRDMFDGKVEVESKQPASTAQPVSDLNHMLQSSSTSSLLEIQATSAQEVTAQDSTSKAEIDTHGNVGSVTLEKNDCTGTVATFFQGDGDDEGDIEIREGPPQSMDKVTKQDADTSKVAQPELSNPPVTEPEFINSGGVFSRAPFLRCDSWISNSSLLTYNHSTTGSQEFLSGSFFGEDGPMSISSVTGLCHSIDDMHLTSPKSLHLLHHQHPLLSARRGNERPLLRRRRSSVEEQILSLPLDATNKLDSTPVASDTRRSSLPNVAVLASPETASENLQTASLSNENFETPPLHSVSAAPQSENAKDTHTEVAQPSELTRDQVGQSKTWAQECATNLEVPLFNPTADNMPSIQTQAGDSITADDSGIMLLTENVEVVPSGTVESQVPVTTVNSGSYKMPSWSREGSAFQPISGRVPKVTPVIQREVPVILSRTVDLIGIRDDSSQEHLKTEPESANLETVPDNVERPLDTDISDSTKKIPGRSPLHSSFSRQHLRETHNSSPATSLWENPELARDFGVVLAPAALPSGSHPVSTQQSALLVPQLHNQQELLDNPLGVSQSSLQTISPKSTSPPSSTVEKKKLDSSIPTETVVSSTESNEKAMTSRSSISPPSAPLDLSSRTAPQGQSATDDDVAQVLSVHSAQSTHASSPQNPSLQNGHPVDGDRQRYVVNDRLLNEADRRNQRRINPADDYSGPRNWNDRNAYVGDSGDDYDRQNTRRNDAPLFDRRGEREGAWNERSRDWERDREWQHSSNSYYQYRYDGRSDRERSRPSSRSSNQDYDAGSRDRYYDRSRYPPFEDNVGRDPAFSQRPSSRSGYESDQGSGHHRRPPYDPYHGDYYQQDPRYSAPYNDYYRYAREQYDPRQYSIPYYGANQYNYGYYAELYGNDPRYRAYYDSMAKDYYWQYGGQYRYDDYDRRSVHSGRSSITDDSRKENEHFTNAFHSEGSSHDQAAEVTELSTIYPPDNMYYPEGVDISANNFEQFQSTADDVPAVALQRLTPAKFSSPHMRASFSPSGQLIILPPNSIAEGQAAAVEICDFQGIFSDDPIAQELNNFPSPLIRGETHKNDVIQYCIQKIRNAKEDQNLPDRDSCVLIWELLVLLIRQNGVVMGTDIAELLLNNRDATSEKTASVTDIQLSGSNELLLSNGAAVVSNDNKRVSYNATIMDGESSQKFMEFLLFGHKKDGLEWAMKRGLWGHALFLASKMDSRTYAMVMTRFANSLAFNDPLQTLYQLMSGRQPAAVTCIADEKWGDWRPHLAIILSNPSQRPDLDCRSVITLGDTLAGRGYLHAAHFCYLMAQVEFGSYDKKSSKLVLIGANHSVPFNHFATIEAIKCTEVYEYVQSLANPNYVLPNLQLYKFIYATRLAEHGHPQEALHYCEVITRAIQKMPALYDVEIVRQVYELASRLKYYDPYYTQEEGEVAEMGDPLWLRELLSLFHSYSNGAVQPVAEYSDSADGAVMNSAADVNHPHPDYGAQNIASEAGLLGDVQYQQCTNYVGSEQRSSMDASHQYSTYYENSQHEMVYSDTNLPPSNLSRNAVNQQNYSEGCSEKAAPQMTEDYSSQNVANSQYDYYGNAISSQMNSTVPEYNDLVDGASSVSPENVDYYSASVYKNSLPPSSTSSEAPRTATVTDHSKPSSGSQQQEKPKPKKTEDKGKPKQGGSWLGGIFSKFSLKGPNQMILPDDKNPTLVWDATANKWVSSDGDDESDTAGPVAPPKDMELPTNSGPSPLSAPFPPTESMSAEPEGNRFKLRPVRGMKHNYVDVLGGNTVPMSSKALPPQLLSTVDTLTSSIPSKAVPQFFIPTPAVDSESVATDFVTTAPGVQPSSRVANPASRGGSPQDETDPDDSSQRSWSSSQSSLSQEVQSYLPGHQSTDSQDEIVSPGQPLMFDPSRMDQAGTSFARNAVPAGPRGGLQKYGGRYPR